MKTGPGETGAQDLEPNLIALEFALQRFGKCHQHRLRRGIGRLTSPDQKGRHGSDIDNRAPLNGAHQAERCVAEADSGGAMKLNHCLMHFSIDVGKIAHRPKARVVDQIIDTWQAADDFRETGDLDGIGQVGGI